MMSNNKISSNQKADFLFIGAGLANLLAAVKLRQNHPRKKVIVVEKNKAFNAGYTWSFHSDDITSQQHEWVKPMVSKSWPGYEVRFPGYTRIMRSGYYSVKPRELIGAVLKAGVEVVWGVEVTPHPDPLPIRHGERELHSALPIRHGERELHSVSLGGRESLADLLGNAKAVLDGRGWEQSPHCVEAYQKFVGLDVELENPHGLNLPIVMDATIEQLDGYRFFYVLPWTETSLLIEDTRYSDSPALNLEDYCKEIHRYAEKKGWVIKTIQRRETGVLPIPVSGHSRPPTPSGPIPWGTRAGFFHATTGYSFPDAVRMAEKLSEQETFDPPHLLQWCKSQAETHWRRQGFYRFLNRMMFYVPNPEHRYRILEKFYSLPEPLIARFYAGKINFWDKARLLSGKPPVDIRKLNRMILRNPF